MSEIQKLKDAGFSDEEISGYLGRAGFTNEEISKAIQGEVQEVVPNEGGVPGGKPQHPNEGTPLSVPAARYGLPVVASMAGPWAGGAGALAGEIIARGEEEKAGLRTYDDASSYIDKRMNDALHGGFEAVTSILGDKWLSPLVGAVTRNTIKRPLAWVGRKLLTPKSIPADIKGTQELLKIWGRSLTLDQLSHEEQNMMSQLGAIVRSAYGSRGMMRKADLANLKPLQEAADAYLDSVAGYSGREDFGKILKALMTGELDFVKKHRKALYDVVRAGASKTTTTVDMRPTIAYFKKEIAQMGREDAEKARALIADLLPSDPKKGTRISLTKAIEATERLNAAYGKTNLPPGTTQHIKKKIVQSIDDALKGSDPQLLDAWNTAKMYTNESAKRLQDGLIGAITKKLDTKPSAVIAMLRQGQGLFDNLNAIEKAFTQSAAERSTGVGTTLSKDLFRKNVMNPLRYSLLMDAQDNAGRITAKGLGKIVRTLKDDGMEKVFGADWGPMLKKLAIAMDVVERSPSGDKVFIQLAQGGKLVQLAGGAAALGSQVSDEPILKKFGTAGAALFVAPLAFASAMRNPPFVRALTDGIEKGVKSTAFQRAFIMLTNQYAHDRFDKRDMTPEQLEFYSDPTNKFTELGKPDPINKEITQEMEGMRIGQ